MPIIQLKATDHIFLYLLFKLDHWAQPSECGRQRTLNSLHGHTAAWLQSNGNLAV